VTRSLFLVIAFAAATGDVFGQSSHESQPATQSEEADLYALFLDKWTAGAAKVIHIARVAEPPPPKR
jgi:hypothetical protein